MNSTTAYQMLSAVADEVAFENDLPESLVSKLLNSTGWVDSFTESLIRVATKANPHGHNQGAEDDACADYLRNSHERVLLGLKAFDKNDFFTHCALNTPRSEIDRMDTDAKLGVQKAMQAIGVDVN